MTRFKTIPVNPNLHKKIIDFWEKDKNYLETSEDLQLIRPDEYQDYIVIKDSHPLHDLLNIPVPYFALVYLRSLPRAGLGPVHIDSKRQCALNIPIQVDLDSSFFFVANQECTEREPYENEPVNVGSKRYIYEPEKYNYYNLREPCLLDTKTPHGFANFANTERILLSIGFLESYDTVLTHLRSL